MPENLGTHPSKLFRLYRLFRGCTLNKEKPKNNNAVVLLFHFWALLFLSIFSVPLTVRCILFLSLSFLSRRLRVKRRPDIRDVLGFLRLGGFREVVEGFRVREVVVREQ